MASYRRVVRTNSSWSDPVLPVQETQKNKLSLFFIRSITCIWQSVKILWYWFERLFLLCFILVVSMGLAWWLSQKPSLNRDWLDVDSIVPVISWSGDTVNIDNIRNHTWKTEDDFVPGYLNLSYSIDDIESMQYIVTPFSEYDWPAHVMVSFTFSWGRHIVVSPEIRKEKWEVFDAINGALNQYELYYVIATEDDIIKLRTNYRKNEVYMYPINTDTAKVQAIFRSMLIRTKKLLIEPEFYNTLWNNCATNVLTHANAFRTNKLAAGINVLLPAHSDEFIYNEWLINTNLSFPDAKDYYRIDQDAMSVSGEMIFSEKIHKPIK